MSGTTYSTGALRQIVPLQTVPAQVLNTTLNGQYCQINVYQRTTGLFVDVGLNGLLVVGGILALDRNWIIRDFYRGFLGDITFWDSQGTEDPDWTGIGQRFFLGYWPPV
ncbi:MAG TPA: hypothetical protein VGF65_11295 [Mycobacterium sp.]|jgi:hypothetical protein